MSVGLSLTKARRRAGLTQAQLASAIGTTQSVIARAEAGRVTPSIRFLAQVVEATGESIDLGSVRLVPADRRRVTTTERRARVRRALRGRVFNPWDRHPTPPEARSLEADGLTRERFQR